LSTTKQEWGDGLKAVYDVPAGHGVRIARVNGSPARYTLEGTHAIRFAIAPAAGATVELDLLPGGPLEPPIAVLWEGSFEKRFTIIPSDTSDLPRTTSAIHVHAPGGSVRVRTFDGEEKTFNEVAPGAILHVAATRVFKTGTTAPLLVGCL
jgi:hypothetical protein